MGQNDLVDAVSQASGAKKTEAAKMVTAMLDAIRDALKRDGKVVISGFGMNRSEWGAGSSLLRRADEGCSSICRGDAGSVAIL